MEITVKKLSELRPAAKNVRRHTDKQIAEYIRSLEMFGQIKPIIADEHGEIIAGNGLYQALVQMGKETCDCYILSGLSENQKKKLMLADNRVYELGITDMDAFDEIIRELGNDIDVPGWDEDLLSMMNAAAEDVDDIVNGYGSYEEADVSRLAERKAPDNVPTSAPVETPVATPQVAPQPEGSQGQVQRVIVCPKCGEQICL
ncbi:MAG: ParB N-terminal domain-containing protein [Oscillospiraceae bacterium]|nr:ParB N-terminal domain-containing protein [Oscillospiraceae bacterium]